MAVTHGRKAYFSLDTLGGALTDISGFLRSTGGLPGTADRPNTDQFGDNAMKRDLLGKLDGGSISLGGLWKATTAAKHGRGVKILFNQYPLTGKTRTCTVSRNLTLDQSDQFGDDWIERDIVGKLDGSVSFGGLFNGASSDIDDIFRAARVSETNPIVSVGYAGYAIGSLVDMVKVAMTQYEVPASHDAPVEVTGEFSSDDMIDLGISLHDLEAETTTGSSSSVDETAATANGAVGHIHVTAWNGTSATVKIEHSANDADWSDLITFTEITGTGSERVETTATADVYRYVRCTISAATVTSFTFQVSLGRRNFVYGTAGTYRHFAGMVGTQLLTEPPPSYSFAYGPSGSVAGSRKYSGECRLSSLEVSASHDAPLEFSAELQTTGTISEGTF